ncbi:MAG TPA: hypothetical protein VJR89_33055 [Polyangiales bacterium]|nr:hypothetical protein [Polyangiales bacterium]
MRELLDHLVERESVVRYFYCDHRGLVTIAIGYLVDQEHAPDATGKRLARELARRANVTFTDSSNVRASETQVEQDWDRVKNHGRNHRGATASDFARVAQLRISSATVFAITEEIVVGFLNQLYSKRPFIIHYDPRVAMAFVDVRYNPAGVKLYDNHGPVQQMWNALDPRHRDFNLERAMILFEQIWAGRGHDRYSVRHYMRAKWMRAGLLASGALEGGVSV